MKFKFVVTSELQEALDSFKEMGEVMKNPRNWLEGIGIFTCLIMLYFGLILIG